MSVLVKYLRSALFTNLRPDMDPKLRKVAWDLFNSVDADLDIADYSESSTTDEAIEAFESHLSGKIHLPDEELIEVEEPVATEEPQPPTPRISEIKLDDDE